MALKKFCLKSGCKNLVEGGGYCEAHAIERKQEHQQNDRQRGTAAERGYDSRWRKARQGYLRKHPLCKHCREKDKLTQATVVDHIIPHKGDKALFWDRDNWQPLCKQCHDIKTATEDGGFNNPRKGR